MQLGSLAVAATAGLFIAKIAFELDAGWLVVFAPVLIYAGVWTVAAIVWLVILAAVLSNPKG